MKLIKKNMQVILGFIVGMILASGITVYAYSYFAKDISYTKRAEDGTETEINVQQALNELYNKSMPNLTLVEDLSEWGQASTRRDSITKTFTAEANTDYYIIGHYSASNGTPSVYSYLLTVDSGYTASVTFSNNVIVLGSIGSNIIKIRANSSGTVTMTIKGGGNASTQYDFLMLHIYK